MSKPIMILGCSSDAGKSFLVTALCRYFANRGERVAPFKAQNMSNNAAVTVTGGEIGRAQYLQALAARVTPDVRMNPVLLKPSSDTASQVILLGLHSPDISALPWMARRAHLWPIVQTALQSLSAEYDRLIIEGAGSPAEVNLRAVDIVNMEVALECGADVYLVADIDRGGAFAHLLGTWECLERREQALVKGFVLNKFRGDPALLDDATGWLQARTGIPTVALIPMLTHRLPEEDTLHYRARPAEGGINIALIAYPYASNVDEFDPLIHEEGVTVVPVRELTALHQFHAVILPGSKNSAQSLRHLRATGFAAELARVAQQGIPVLGICGGLQILGQRIMDPDNLEGGDLPGLGLLDLETTLMPHKVTSQRVVPAIGGGTLTGYEIHHGQTSAGAVQPYLIQDLGWQQGNVYGVYLHGLFENTWFRQQFLERLGWQGKSHDWSAAVDQDIEQLALVVEQSGWFKERDRV